MFLRKRILGSFVLVVLGLLSATWSPQLLRAQEVETLAVAEVQQPPPLCRLGVNALHGDTNTFEEVDLTPLRVGWYIDYRASATPARPNGIEYAPVIRLTQIGNGYFAWPNGAQLQQAIAGNPGADWIIGNEPDRRAVPGDATDDLLPPVYALAYHDLYHTIKQADPTARVFAGAIVQPTPLRLRYLDLVMRSYFEQFGAGMPVDGWAIHNFILNEVSCDAVGGDHQVCWGAEIPPGIDEDFGLVLTVDQNDDLGLFVEQVRRFRQWMTSRGYAGKPLYVSEYGVLMPERLGFPPDRVNQFMNRTFDFLLNETDQALGDPTDGYRLVQRLAWFSTVPAGEFNGYLYERSQPSAPFQLSPMGQNWVSYTGALAVENDLYPVRITFDPPAPLADSGNVTFTVRAQIANAGNALSAQSVTVRFYDGDPSAGGDPIGDPQTVTLAGCGDHAWVAVTWPDVAPGDHRVYVWVDPANSVPETDKGNNLKSASPFFASDQAFLPLLYRAPFAQ
jgi:hypothetical protein